MRLKFWLLFAVTLLTGVIAFTSCEKEELTTVDATPGETLQNEFTADSLDVTLADTALQRFAREKNYWNDMLANIQVDKVNDYMLEKSSAAFSPISGAVTSIYVNHETNEWNSDEPYVVVCAIQLPNASNSYKSGVRATLTGVWSDADTKESKGTVSIPNIWSDIDKWDTWQNLIRQVVRRPFWGMNGKTQRIDNPNDVIFLVAMMEHDDTPISYVQNSVEIRLQASLYNVLAQRLSRDDMVSKLKSDMNSAITAARNIPVLPVNNSDEQLGSTQELRLSTSDLQNASSRVVRRWLRFFGDGGDYIVYFELKNSTFFY